MFQRIDIGMGDWRAAWLMIFGVTVAIMCAVLLGPDAARAVVPVPIPSGVASSPSTKIRVVRARPFIDRGDGHVPSASVWRVTATPNGDRVQDNVVVTACAARSVRLQLRIFNRRSLWFNDQTTPVNRGVPAVRGSRCHRGERVHRMSWNGYRAGDNRMRPGSYVIRVCSARSSATLPIDSHACATEAIVAHETVGYGSVRTLTAVSPGGTAHVDLFIPDRGARVGLLPDTRSSIADVFGPLKPLPRAGRQTISVSIPGSIASGLWHVAVFNRRGVPMLQLPLVVRAAASRIPAPVPPHTALVVWPTTTWAAYSPYDGNRDGSPDSWYFNAGENQTVASMPTYERLVGRPAEADARYLGGFSNWLASHVAGRYTSITDGDLAALTDAQLAEYSAVVFPGHEEYYEETTAGMLERFRDQGGNLIWLSANNMYRRVAMSPDASEITDLDYVQPPGFEYELNGVGIRACHLVDAHELALTSLYSRSRQGPGWLYAGTRLRAGSPFGRLIGEIDGVDAVRTYMGAMTPVAVSGDLPDGIGSCRRASSAATMALAQFTVGGGTVFSSGNMNFVAGLRSATDADAMSAIIGNVWMMLVDGQRPWVAPIEREAAATSDQQQRLARAAAALVAATAPVDRVFTARVRAQSMGYVDPAALMRRIRRLATRSGTREHGARRACAPALRLTTSERDALRRLRALRAARPGDSAAVDNDGEPELRAAGIEPDPTVVLMAAVDRGVRASRRSGMLCVVGR